MSISLCEKTVSSQSGGIEGGFLSLELTLSVDDRQNFFHLITVFNYIKSFMYSL